MGRRNGYFATLDGWRAFSVIAVILFHGRSVLFRDDSIPMKLATRGEIGVDFFFAISGFLICGLLLKEHVLTGQINLRRFYLQRCFRILPAYYTVLAGLTLLALFQIVPINLSFLPSCLLFYRNYRPLGIDGSGGFYTAHYWSLALEEHFYLLWPLLLIAVKPKRAGRAVLLLAGAVFSWRMLEMHYLFLSNVLPQELLRGRTDTRLDGLLWGSLAAIYFPQIKQTVERIRFSQLWLPIAACLLMMEALRVPGSLLWHAILLPALLMSTVLQPQSWLSRILEWRLIRWIGFLSYGMYLWQELFLPQTKSVMARGWFRHLQASPWSFMAILACACLSRYLIEAPVIRFGHRLGQPKGPPQEELRTMVAARPIPAKKYADIA